MPISARADQPTVHLTLPDEVPVYENAPGVVVLEEVDTAEEGALAGPARADDDQHLLSGDPEIDPAEHGCRPVRLVETLDGYHWVAQGCAQAPALGRRW
jgi:hypothetical protein